MKGNPGVYAVAQILPCGRMQICRVPVSADRTTIELLCADHRDLNPVKCPPDACDGWCPCTGQGTKPRPDQPELIGDDAKRGAA